MIGSKDYIVGHVISKDGTNPGKAFITILKGTDPSLFTNLPAFLTIPLVNLAIKANAKKTAGDDVSLKASIPTMHYDLILLRESIEITAMVKNLNTQILLMGGTKSPRFLLSIYKIKSLLTGSICPIK